MHPPKPSTHTTGPGSATPETDLRQGVSASTHRALDMVDDIRSPTLTLFDCEGGLSETLRLLEQAREGSLHNSAGMACETAAAFYLLMAEIHRNHAAIRLAAARDLAAT